MSRRGSIDPAITRVSRCCKGFDNSNFPDAIMRLYKMITDMSLRPEHGSPVAGSLSLTSPTPPHNAHDHRKFLGLLDKNHDTAAWYDRMRSRDTFRAGLVAQFNPKYLSLMEEKGREAGPRVKALNADT